LLNSIRTRRWNTVGHTLRHNKEFHNIILNGNIKEKRGNGKLRICYISSIIKDPRSTRIRTTQG